MIEPSSWTFVLDSAPDSIEERFLGSARSAAARPRREGLLRIAMVWNIPVACNRASADFMISSPLMSSTYQRFRPDYEAYLKRTIDE